MKTNTDACVVMTNTHINYPHNLLWLNSYLIYLSFLGRDSFLSLFLKNLLPLLYIFIRGHCERVVELIITFVHHVPISVGLLQTIPTQLRMSKQTPLSSTHEWHQVNHSLSGPLPTAPSHLHYQTGFLPHHHLSLLKKTTFWTHTLIKNRNMLAFSRKQGAPYIQRPIAALRRMPNRNVSNVNASHCHRCFLVFTVIPFPCDKRGVDPKCFLSLAHSLYLYDGVGRGVSWG